MGKSQDPKILQSSPENINNVSKKIMENSKRETTNSFNRNISGLNSINSAIGIGQKQRNSGSPEFLGFSKNIAQNPFQNIREGIFDIINANAKEEETDYSDQEFVSAPKPNEIPGLIARPDAAPGKSTQTPDAGTVNVAPLSPGVSRAAPNVPQFSLSRDVSATPTQSTTAPMQAKPSSAYQPTDADIKDQDSRADLLDTLRTARAMPKGDSAGRTPEERASNRAARAARGQAISSANIAARRERESMQDAIKAAPDAETKSRLRGELRKFNERSGMFQSTQFGNKTQADIATRYAPKDKTSLTGSAKAGSTPPTGTSNKSNQALPKPAVAGVDTEGPPSSLATGSDVKAKTEKITTGTTTTSTTQPAKSTTPTPGAGARETMGLGREQPTEKPSSLAGEIMGLGKTTQSTEETPAQKRARELLQR